MKRISATALLFLLALVTLSSDPLVTVPKDKDPNSSDAAKQQNGYMTPDGVYVPPAKPTAPMDFNKLLPYRNKDDSGR